MGKTIVLCHQHGPEKFTKNTFTTKKARMARAHYPSSSNGFFFLFSILYDIHYMISCMLIAHTNTIKSTDQLK